MMAVFGFGPRLSFLMEGSCASMTIEVKILADTVSPIGIRLTSMQLRYPRIIHAELMTHRVFSRNASSSRAIPVERQIQDIINDTAMPVRWGKNQRGMQDAGDHDALVRGQSPEAAWNLARDFAVWVAMGFVEAGYHKQVVNRLLEPFSHISVVVTSVYWENWYALRDHEDADPTIRALASEMKLLHDESVPTVRLMGDWHLPYISNSERDQYDVEDLKKMSAARCARVSYNNHDGDPPTYEEDMALFNRLMGNPAHASPLEHQATPDIKSRFWVNPHKHGNLTGYIQHRKLYPNESIMEKY